MPHATTVPKGVGLHYVFWKANPEEGHCICGSMHGWDEVFRIHKGQAVADRFPLGVSYTMSPEFPNDTELADVVRNADGLMLVSGRLKDLLEGEALECVEHLPVAIRDHAGQIASSDYSVVHPTRVCDAIDLSASNITWNDLIPGKIASCVGLRIRPDAIDSSLRLFRLEGFGRKLVVRTDLAEVLAGAGPTGSSFVDVNGFSGF